MDIQDKLSMRARIRKHGVPRVRRALRALGWADEQGLAWATGMDKNGVRRAIAAMVDEIEFQRPFTVDGAGRSQVRYALRKRGRARPC